ncbi:hypothetical protein HRJ34_27355 (plasmid) [Rhizorhabdus wittichii]|uniref:Phenol hydroxylase n=2 Tax=Alphaproteobacteria TaxID=28211 RepID=A0A975D903_9SPHN|nr:hypothetical protein HRJ34_27355 [Rhizorhabdus wittichii]QUM74577.1 hypothetical protein ICN83_20205 [Sphingopyxis granuli]
MEGESQLQPGCQDVASAACGDRDFDPSVKYVRVNGERHGLVEFDFGVGDLALSVEMMLPPEDFRQFCADQSAVMVTARRETAQGDAAVAMSWRPSDVQHLIEQQASLHGEK